MRILKFIAALLLPVLLVLALACPPERIGLWAQLPPSNPNLAPIITPAGVPSLSQPAATVGIPTLAVIPTPAARAAAATPRSFNCSCFGPGSGTSWVGQVDATGYFAARQGAISACLSYNQRKEPASAFNYASSYAGAAVAAGALSPTLHGAGLPPTLPGAYEPADAAGAQVLPGTLNFSSAAQLQRCSRCTCD
jgi:hypothetical protein